MLARHDEHRIRTALAGKRCAGSAEREGLLVFLA